MGANVIPISEADLPRALELGEERTRRAIARGTRLGAERGRAIMVRATPMDQGQLRASWKVKPGEVTIAGRETLIAELLNDAPHAGIIELGARPHAVSPEGWQAIYEWVRRHPELYGAKKARTKVSGTVAQLQQLGPFKGLDPEISQITNAIVWKLRREGQKPTYFVRNQIDNLRRAMIAEIERQLDRVARSAGERGGA